MKKSISDFIRKYKKQLRWLILIGSAALAYFISKSLGAQLYRLMGELEW